MEKQQLIDNLKLAVSSGVISKEEVLSTLSIDNTSRIDASVTSRLSLATIFYYIGGLIVLIGLVVLVAQNWDTFNFPIKVFVTFGMGLAFFTSAIILNQLNHAKVIGNVFFLLSCILIPFGYFVMFDDLVNDVTFNFYNTLVSFLCLLQFGIAQLVLKKDIFTLFNTFFGTWFFFALTNNMIGDNQYGNFNSNFHLYQTILMGVSYTLIGYYLSIKGRLFAGWLNAIGIITILGAGFILNVMAVENDASFIWTVLYPILVVGTIVSSVFLKNSAFLFVGTLCLVGYIIRVSAENFADSLGWPLILILMGVTVMGLGYLAFYLNRKYIKK